MRSSRSDSSLLQATERELFEIERRLEHGTLQGEAEIGLTAGTATRPRGALGFGGEFGRGA
jgi:hypothetical protein